MSWSASAIGKVGPKLKEKIGKEFDRTSCAEPEQTYKNSARDLAQAMIDGQAEGTVVEIVASGWMSGGVHQLSLTVTPKYGFVE